MGFFVFQSIYYNKTSHLSQKGVSLNSDDLVIDEFVCKLVKYIILSNFLLLFFYVTKTFRLFLI